MTRAPRVVAGAVFLSTTHIQAASLPETYQFAAEDRYFDKHVTDPATLSVHSSDQLAPTASALQLTNLNAPWLGDGGAQRASSEVGRLLTEEQVSRLLTHSSL